MNEINILKLKTIGFKHKNINYLLYPLKSKEWLGYQFTPSFKVC